MLQYMQLLALQVRCSYSCMLVIDRGTYAVLAGRLYNLGHMVVDWSRRSLSNIQVLSGCTLTRYGSEKLYLILGLQGI